MHDGSVTWGCVWPVSRWRWAGFLPDTQPHWLALCCLGGAWLWCHCPRRQTAWTHWAAGLSPDTHTHTHRSFLTLNNLHMKIKCRHYTNLFTPQTRFFQQPKAELLVLMKINLWPIRFKRGAAADFDWQVDVPHLYGVGSPSQHVQLLLLSPGAFSASAVFLQVLVCLTGQFLLKAADKTLWWSLHLLHVSRPETLTETTFSTWLIVHACIFKKSSNVLHYNKCLLFYIIYNVLLAVFSVNPFKSFN